MDTASIAEPAAADEFSTVQGDPYLQVLAHLHTLLRPRSYLEIGTAAGHSLKLATCAAIAVDPVFRIEGNVVGTKPSCRLFQCTSERFFRDHSPSTIFGAPVDLAFLDGMHLFENLLADFLNTERHCAAHSVVMLHDCVPADPWMAARVYTEECKRRTQRPGWWTGDVWKCLPALKKYRPDLRIRVVDAAPTGLVLITNLNPNNSVLADNYWKIVDEFVGVDIARYGIRKHQEDCALVSTKELMRRQDLSKFLWI
jgi:hypothetical protein